MAKTDYNVYKINRSSVCFGKRIRYGGWSNQYAVRLWKKNLVKVNENLVHEDYLTEEKIGFIKEQINHYSYLTLKPVILNPRNLKTQYNKHKKWQHKYYYLFPKQVLALHPYWDLLLFLTIWYFLKNLI